MCSRQEKTKKDKREKARTDRAIFKLLGILINAIKWELLSKAGHVNLVFDIILAIIVIVYLLSNSMTALVRIIASVFNEKLTEGTKDNFALLLIILIVAYLACLVIMFIVDQEKQLAPKSEGVNQEIRKPGFHGNNPEENN